MTGKAPYRLACFDVDGTLIGPGGELTPATIAAVTGLVARGVVVAVATARPYEIALPPIAPLAGSLACVVAAAGADIRDADGNPIAQAFLPVEAARAIAQLCDEQDWRTMASTVTGTYRRLPAGVSAPAPSVVTPVTNLRDASLEQTFVMAPYTEPDDPAFPALEAVVEQWGLRAERALTSEGRAITAVTHASAGKGAALERLCDRYGIPAAATVAFGDTEVDAPMIAFAGLGVAMGDAPPSLKAIAGLVTETASEEGVASAIARIWGEAAG